MAELIVAATDALAAALSRGDDSHPPGSWAEEPQGNHFNHLTAHLRKLQNGIEFEDGEDHLANFICRAVMIRAERMRAKAKE
jgi:hypothetical protein